jgi:Mn2+/Fe2+ NRAMP family transporter
MGWQSGLERKAGAARGFYAVIAVSVLAGLFIQYSPIGPMKMLFWSAVINGVVAVPVMAIMMHMTGNPKIMGRFPVHDGLRFVGWIATGVMAAAAVTMVVTAVL